MTEEILYGSTDTDYREPDTAPRPAATRAKAPSLLDEFREAATAEISNIVYFPIEHRKGDWVAQFDAVIGQPDIKKYRRQAMGKKTKAEDMDTLIANGMALIEKNTGLYKGGTNVQNRVLDADGDPLTFRSDEFLDLYPDCGNAVECLARFLGDAQLTTMGEALFRAAGYGKDLEPVDPTNG